MIIDRTQIQPMIPSWLTKKYVDRRSPSFSFENENEVVNIADDTVVGLAAGIRPQDVNQAIGMSDTLYNFRCF